VKWKAQTIPLVVLRHGGEYNADKLKYNFLGIASTWTTSVKFMFLSILENGWDFMYCEIHRPDRAMEPK